jgi:Xaa-Pro aminopeptidase
VIRTMTKNRIVGLRALMKEQGLEALLITNGINRRYMTGFTGTSGYVVITDSRAFLFTDFRYMTQAPMQAPDYEVVEHGAKATDVIRETLLKLGLKKLGFEKADVSYGTYTGYVTDFASIELVPAEPLVEKLRMKKDAEELRVMKEAAELADRTFLHMLDVLKPGLTEKEVALELEFFMRKHGASATSFDTIVASGERSALPHGVASDRVLQPGEFVKLDFGALYQGYCSDITRTVVLGKPNERHREIYRIVLEAQEYALANIRPGMTGKQADGLARDIIGKYGYADKFGHGLGHGLGLEIHEAPRLSPTGEIVLEPGMTVTVEPGIYLPGFGGVRIEDDIVVTDQGVERLTWATKEFICID